MRNLKNITAMGFMLRGSCANKAITINIHSDTKKRRSFLAPLFTAGDVKASKEFTWQYFQGIHMAIIKFEWIKAEEPIRISQFANDLGFNLRTLDYQGISGEIWDTIDGGIMRN